jgi:uncharacterized membrane protein (DUF485 family)
MKPISQTFQAIVNGVTGKESFNDMTSLSGGNKVMLVVLLVVYLLLILLVGKWLWNNVLCKTVTFAKPMPNVLTLLGLVILLELVLPC